jgi:hypothetical protein
MISDLKTKIKDLDNEKNSLVTTIKILQEGQKYEETGPLNAFKRQSANSTEIKNNSSRAVCTSGIQTHNRYSILSETDNDGEDTLTSQKRFESGITPVAKDTVSVTKNSGTETIKIPITGHQKLSLLRIPSLNILTQKSLQRGK